MLTREDLEQIRGVVRSEIKTLKTDIGTLKKDMRVVKKDIRQLKEDSNRIINFFDNEDAKLRERVERIENHLGL